jgi:5-methylthioadenosine/S-adenosylhomocysteine deaminase
LQGIKGGVSHNPISNMKLGCGVAPILLMRELGITVGMGTDGAGSATTLDMFEELLGNNMLSGKQLTKV